MKFLKNIDKISLIKKTFKRENIVLELSLLNYSGCNLYIFLIQSRKMNNCKLYWFDLNEIKDKKIKKYISCENIEVNVLNYVKSIYSNYVINDGYKTPIINDKNIVSLNANIRTGNTDVINFSFNRYLPKELENLSNLFIFIFKNIPKKYEGLLYMILAKLTDSTEKYEYKENFEFDLFKGNIDKIFQYQIVERGKKYYEEDKVTFLEKINDKYFAVVEGSKKYVVIIRYHEKEKIMQVYCDCPCEFFCKHVYAVILAIRNGDFKRFYKIMIKDKNQDLYEKIVNFDYLLCLGIYGKSFEIINKYGFLESIPIFDEKGEICWEVLEDTDGQKLAKQLKKL